MTDLNNAGHVDIHHPQPLVAGQLVTVQFKFTVGPREMREGGRLRVGLPNVGWAIPEVPQYYFWSDFARGRKRRYTQYDRVNTTARIESARRRAVTLLETEAQFYRPWRGQPRWLTEYDRFWITVTLEDAGLDAGGTGEAAPCSFVAQIHGLCDNAGQKVCPKAHENKCIGRAAVTCSTGTSGCPSLPAVSGGRRRRGGRWQSADPRNRRRTGQRTSFRALRCVP